MKLNSPQPEILGDLGAGSGQRLAPERYDYYERQWRTQRGAWGDPEEVRQHLHADVLAVIDAFRSRGAAAGLAVAARRGVQAGARVYLDIRAWTEEELASLLARIRARMAHSPTPDGRIREAFVLARLMEVREAISRNHTPDQAVIDKPDVPRRGIPRWLVILGYSLTGVGVALGVVNYVERKRGEA